MNPGKIVSGIVGLVGALWLGFAGFYAGEWWEHRPPGQPAWANVHVLLWRWSPPPSLAAQLAVSQAALALEHQNFLKVDAALSDQNARVRELGSRGQAATTRANQAVAAYRSAQNTVAHQVQVISSPIQGDDECARVRDVHAKVQEATR